MSFTLFSYTPLSTSLTTVSSSFSEPKNPSTRFLHTKKQPKNPIKKVETLAARDTVIDFGKHKGKMLGTLPSTYLKWVSKNLRARDLERWAQLADEVLDDPVYRDRIEWEFAEKILQGSDRNIRNAVSMGQSNENNAVLMLLEISERFGWDNEDKAGWNRLNFELLGTSKGGRLPRLMHGRDNVACNARNESEQNDEKSEEVVDGEERRRERRNKVRSRREAETNGKVGINGQKKGVLGIAGDMDRKKQCGDEKEPKVDIYNPFPGRESLLKKVLNKRRFL